MFSGWGRVKYICVTILWCDDHLLSQQNPHRRTKCFGCTVIILWYLSCALWVTVDWRRIPPLLTLGSVYCVMYCVFYGNCTNSNRKKKKMFLAFIGYILVEKLLVVKHYIVLATFLSLRDQTNVQLCVNIKCILLCLWYTGGSSLHKNTLTHSQ